MKFYIKNEQGYSLLITLFTFVLISLFGFSLFIVTNNTMKTSANERIDQSVYYVAEAGLVEKRAALFEQIQKAHQQAVAEYTNQLLTTPLHQQTINFQEIFKKELDKTVDISSDVINDFEKNFSHQATAEIEIHREEHLASNIISYTIYSTGSLNDKERKVSQRIVVALNTVSTIPDSGTGNVGDFAVYSKNNITYGYYGIKDQVKGHLASASTSQVEVNGWYPEPIHITYDPDSFDQLVNETFQQQLHFDSSAFENIDYRPNHSPLIKGNSLIGNWNEHHNQVLTLTDHLKLDTFSTSSNLTLTIDVGHSDKILYVEDLTLDGTLNIVGAGSLTIFVKESLNFKYSNINVNGDPNKLNIYYAGTNPITIANGLHLKANLFIKNADLTFSGGAGISGSFYSNGTGKTLINGGTVSKDVLFVMPHSNFTITGGANLIGSILCNELFIDGGAKIDSKAGGGLGGAGTIRIESANPIQLKPIIEVHV